MDHPIEVDGLRKTFAASTNVKKGILDRVRGYLAGDNARMTVLDSFDLKVKKGEIYGLLGPNGSGKTTLVRILSATMLPDAGRAAVNGLDVSESSNKDGISASIGVILGERSRSFYWRLTARQNLEFYASMYDLDGKAAKDRVDYVLDFVGLGKRKDDRIFSFSSGMLNRLAIARAFLHSPDILLLDEFLVNLDPKASYDTREVIKDFARKEGKTVFFTSNNAYEAECLADRVGILFKGRLAAEGTVEELKRRLGGKDTTIRMHFDAMPMGGNELAEHLRKGTGVSAWVEDTMLTMVTPDPMGCLARTVRLLKSRKMHVRNVEVLPSSLESVFINVTREKDGS